MREQRAGSALESRGLTSEENQRRTFYTKGYNRTRFGALVRRALVEHRAVPSALALILNLAMYPAIKLTLSDKKRTFAFRGEQLHYWTSAFPAISGYINSERVVELAIVNHLLSGRRTSVLEIGNVLPRFMSFPHTIVDKYETGEGIINADVTDLRVASSFDTIISISTLEHVGFDEEDLRPERFRFALDILRNLLKPAGLLVVTLPVGYNPEVDRFLADGAPGFGSTHFLVRQSCLNIWVETNSNVALAARYDSKYPHANAIAILIATGSPSRD